jgi:hypothetical protein
MGYHGQAWDVNTFFNKTTPFQMFALRGFQAQHVVGSRTSRRREWNRSSHSVPVTARPNGNWRKGGCCHRRYAALAVTEQSHSVLVVSMRRCKHKIWNSCSRLAGEARRSVSRVLCRPDGEPQRANPKGRTTGAARAIHLGRSSPNASRDRPERRCRRPARRRRRLPTSPAAPTWSCSRWGLPCRCRCRRRGALLPHHFTLAAPPKMRSAVCFCGTFPGVAPAGRYPAPYLRGARTFLPSPCDEERPSDRLAWDHVGNRRLE